MNRRVDNQPGRKALVPYRKDSPMKRALKSRRDFLRAAGAVAAFTVVPRYVLGLMISHLECLFIPG